jgi:hypothetical protein
MIGFLIASLVMVLAPFAMSSVAWAAGPDAMSAGSGSSAFAQGPASSDQLALYARIASVNTCLATRAGEDFEKAAGVAGETIAQLILGVHQGRIETSGTTPLTLEELRKGSINAAVIGATEICPQQVPAELSEKVKQALASQATSTRG